MSWVANWRRVVENGGTWMWHVVLNCLSSAWLLNRLGELRVCRKVRVTPPYFRLFVFFGRFLAARIHYVDQVEYHGELAEEEVHDLRHLHSGVSTPPSRISPHGSPQLQQSQRLGKHLSKSASELNGHDCHHNESPHISPKRAKSAVAQQIAGQGSGATGAGGVASGVGVLQKTHGFFNNLRHRWSRAKSKDRLGRKSPSDFLEESTDYAADYSSESSSVTQSPRHRSTTIGGSPLAREFRATAKMAQVIQRFGGSMEGRIDEHPENGAASHPPELTTQQQLEALQVGLVSSCLGFGDSVLENCLRMCLQITFHG